MKNLLRAALSELRLVFWSLGETFSDMALMALYRLGLVMFATEPGKVPFRGRGDVERTNFVRAQALTVNGPTPFSKEFRLGAGWHVMWLHIAVTVVIGTGAGVQSDGLLRLIRKVLLKTDRGEVIANIAGRALWYMAAYRMGTRPQIGTLAAANGTYDVYLPIFFSDPIMVRPEDTILDTGRYQSVDLEVTLGSTSDLYTAPGTATYTATIDIDVERTYGRLPDEAKPHYFVQYASRPPQDASSNPNIELEKSSDLSYKRLYSFTGDTGSGGIEWSGNANDTYPQRTNISDQDRQIEKDRVHGFVQALNKTDAALETVLAGVEVFDFVKDKAITSALSSAGKSSLQLALTQSGAAANSIMTLSYEGIRLLKQ